MVGKWLLRGNGRKIFIFEENGNGKKMCSEVKTRCSTYRLRNDDSGRKSLSITPIGEDSAKHFHGERSFERMQFGETNPRENVVWEKSGVGK